MNIGNLLLILSILSLTSCGKSDLTGDIYLAKNDGSITRMAGTNVFLLPYNTEAEFYGAVYEKLQTEKSNITKIRFMQLLAEEIKGSNELRQTDIQGSYKFNKLASREYLIFAEYVDSFNNGFWLKNFEIASDVKMDLNHTNYNQIPFINYVYIKISQACFDCETDKFLSSLIKDRAIINDVNDNLDVLLVELQTISTTLTGMLKDLRLIEKMDMENGSEMIEKLKKSRIGNNEEHLKSVNRQKLINTSLKIINKIETTYPPIVVEKKLKPLKLIVEEQIEKTIFYGLLSS